MKGWGCQQPRDRKYWRIYGPRSILKGRKIDHRIDGKPLRTKEDCDDTLDLIAHQLSDPEHYGRFDLGVWGKDRLGLLCNAWAAYQEGSPCGEKRSDAREKDWQHYIEPLWGDLTLNQLTKQHAIDLQLKLPAHLKPSTKRRIISTVKAFLKFHEHPLSFPPIKITRKAPAWLTKEEQEARLKFVHVHHHAIFRVLMRYAMRVSEPCKLEHSDIDWLKRIITIRDRKNDRDNTLPIYDDMIQYLKGSVGASRASSASEVKKRDIPSLCSESNASLKGCTLDERPGPRLIRHIKYVFCTERGNPYTRSILDKIWNKALKDGGFPQICVKNATRHSRICQLLNEGKTVPFVARLAGNSPSVIERSYANISVDTLREEQSQTQEWKVENERD